MIPVPATPGQLKNALLGILAGVGALLLVLLILSLVGYIWWLRSEADRGKDAAAAAAAAQANARSADAGAANATTTRASMDTATIDLRVTTEAAAERIENASHPADDQPGAGDDIVRELEDAEAGYRTAADRLQRARTH